MPSLHLSVDKAAFHESLRYLNRLIKKRAVLSDLFWTYEDSNLILEFELASAHTQAKGNWSGQIRCSPLVIRAMLIGLTTDDPIEIHSDTTRLVVGNQSFDCKWDEVRGRPAILSSDAKLDTILALRLKYKDDEIIRSGLMGIVIAAEKKYDAIITRSASGLRPLGITPLQLRDFIKEWLRRKGKNGIFSLGQDEVRQMLDHAYYEIQQFINLLRLYNQSLPHSANDETARQTLNNAKLESLLIHSRILLDFFEISAAQRHLNDALCEDYGFPARHIDISEQDRTRINKEVTHLTYSRPPLTAPDQDRGWKLNILMPLLERCNEFIEFIFQNFPAGQSKYSREDWIGLGRGIK